MKKIGIIEDDRLLSEALDIALTKAGYETYLAGTYMEGLRMAEDNLDLILMDIGLPGGDGCSLCREIRKRREIPFIFLTARDEEPDILEAFDAGADDYVVKPFSIQVLLKRIQAVLRRNVDEERTLRYLDLEVDFRAKKVRMKGEEVSLTLKEYQLLSVLAEHRGQVMSKEQLLELVWDLEGAFVGENTVSVTVNRLRKKIEPNAAEPLFIKNIFGMGYQFGE